MFVLFPNSFIVLEVSSQVLHLKTVPFCSKTINQRILCFFISPHPLNLSILSLSKSKKSRIGLNIQSWTHTLYASSIDFYFVTFCHSCHIQILHILLKMIQPCFPSFVYASFRYLSLMPWFFPMCLHPLLFTTATFSHSLHIKVSIN